MSSKSEIFNDCSMQSNLTHDAPILPSVKYEKHADGSLVVWDMRFVTCSPEPKTIEISELHNPNKLSAE